jgi:hypothetical protein
MEAVMKLRFIAFLSFLAFATLGIAPSAHARDDEIGQCNIPFEFYAGKQKMPAGSYNIGIDLENDVMSLTEMSGKLKIFLMGSMGSLKNESDGTSVVEFSHLGNVYALEELKSEHYDWIFQTWTPKTSMGSRNAPSHV